MYRKSSELWDCTEQDEDEIPNLKAFPAAHLDSFSEVPGTDSPPLLHISSPSCNSSHLNRLIPKAAALKKDLKSNEKNSLNLQARTKTKRMSKKKKRKPVYENLSAENKLPVETFTCAKDTQENTDSKIGSCQIKNGILKIRLSKLTDGSKKENSEKDYEISNSEAAAFGCKRLSVPLEPLAPSVYSAYCVPYKSKKKDHSVKTKRPGKKKDKKVSERKNVVDSFITSPSADLCDKSENGPNLSDCKADKESDTLVNTEDEPDKSICDVKMNLKSETSSEISNKKNSKNEINDIHHRSPVISINSPVFKDNSLEFSNNINVEDSDSKILCTIDLSKINRIPIKSSNFKSSEKTVSRNFRNDIIKKIDDLNPPHDIEDDYNKVNPLLSCKNNDSTCIKKEILTPPTFEVAKVYQNSSEIEDSSCPNLIDENRDDCCPKLKPAFPFEVTLKENELNKIEFESNNAQLPKLCSASTDYISDCTDENSKQSIVFPHNTIINKVKLELADSGLSTDDRWNKLKNYQWSHVSSTDLTFNNGNALFKNQVTYNLGNHRFWQDSELKKQYSSEYYLNEAKKLKHQADKEIDRMVQAMKYLEAVLYFILTGNAMEHSYIDTDRVHTMYKETLTLIRFISSKFQKLHNSSCRNIDNKLTVLSLRCQSLLYLKMYQLRRDEVRYLHRNISTYVKLENDSLPEEVSPPHLQSFKSNVKHSQVSPSYQASPCSLTPSPAGSVASVSSQSSGYSSSELGWSTNYPSNSGKTKSQIDVFSDSITVSRQKYKMFQQQSMYLANLHLSHDLWEHADYLSSEEHSREFFMELDKECGCLSLHSPFSALVYYVRKGLYKLKDGT
ncbi:putative uncharacterized protein DDB_G0282499 isoform X2 [Parasteatoda tepidariorum]|uniref:putative uncharacterized protein DDB_G0282499 isoform X2 n=1 Tax=Parasteatoda tepidariorum TaxID=114398 RepID=UPI001C726872|nr:uncharacterized protein LOC107437342 isoform X2 [Parasteatoda tepidariorum]